MLRFFTEKCIKGYQIAIRPLFPSSCIFYAHGKFGCSDYMINSMQTRGFLKGIIYGIYRILRCHPWQKDFSDPEDKS